MTVVVESSARSGAQRMSALRVANARRTGMAKQRQRIMCLPHLEGCELVSDLLQFPTEDAAALSVERLLTAIHGVGRLRLGRWLARADIRTPDRRVRELTDRQRTALASVVRKGQLR